ncbi:MAG: PLD nuclease N-terminal domain-containing protein [Jatrophihabitantaceae bacterium]
MMFSGFVGLIAIAVWIYCFVDVLLTPEQQCRNLPKLAWVFIVLLFADIGSIAWLIAGRPWVAKGASRPGGGGKPVARKRTVPMNPDDDEEFLASLRARAEEQRRRARGSDGGEDKV